jgi:hypothetical protein
MSNDQESGLAFDRGNAVAHAMGGLLKTGVASTFKVELLASGHGWSRQIVGVHDRAFQTSTDHDPLVARAGIDWRCGDGHSALVW